MFVCVKVLQPSQAIEIVKKKTLVCFYGEIRKIIPELSPNTPS